MEAQHMSSSADGTSLKSKLRQVASQFADFSRTAAQHVGCAMRKFGMNKWHAFAKWTRRALLSTGDLRTIILPNGGTMQLIYCEPGKFLMGSPKSEEGRESDEEQHEVCIAKGFWLGKYAVTQEQWQSVMGNNPSRFKGDRNPVENISQRDCWHFVGKIDESLNCGARLPTEAEWEYACRAGTTTAYNWGNAFKRNRANCHNGQEEMLEKRRTTPVGQYKANSWGFHDMHGNVMEWVADAYGYPDDRGPNPPTYARLKGGCWDDFAKYCRSASRSSDRDDCTGYGNGRYGFRLCCDGDKMNEYFEKTLQELIVGKPTDADCSTK